MRIKRVLMLAGSPESRCMYNLSLRYTRDCFDALSRVDGFSFHVAVVQPNGDWRFSQKTGQPDLCLSDPVSRDTARDILRHSRYDVALPQLFCRAGMTDYRALLERLQIPFIGNTADVMGITANKATTKDSVSNVGVPVPAHQVMRGPDLQRLNPPFIVKPNDSDNSFGVSLVHHRSEIGKAFAAAREHSSCVLAEQFIPAGREVRCGIIQLGSKLECLPLQEYPLTDRNSIRQTSDKLIIGEAGSVELASKFKTSANTVPIADPATRVVWDMAKRCHRALGCRDYSLFDFRIDPNGTPYFMEAGLYCSFAPKSILALMANEQGIGLETFFRKMAGQAMNRSGVGRSVETLRNTRRITRANYINEPSKLET